MQRSTSKNEALIHLKKDKVLKKLITQVGEIKLRKETDLYFSLCRSIVSQQLSIKAAATIFGRFLVLFKKGYPEPGLLLKLSDEQLRAVGLSYQKAGYLKNIARFSFEKTLDYKKLKKMSDDELIDFLVQIKGVGRWTVEMILMFNLNRPDILPKDDLGIQNGIIKQFGLQESTKKELHKKMELIAENWRPHRTLACLYIWKYKDSAL
ncbi:MAG: DNA-3-methyladenine glycosylase 2 family protein [bacterium]|nr:DNA-3-methyladenine glycosylase 2 family protein [bacterium]